MGDLRSLAKAMRLTAEAVDNNAIAAVKSITEAIAVTLVYATPIDTSRARLNWQGTVGAPATTILSPYPEVPSSPNVGTSTAIASINEAAASYTGQPEGVFITNNVPYIQSLNDGSSSQAPANFVAMSVIAGINSAQNVKLLP